MTDKDAGYAFGIFLFVFIFIAAPMIDYNNRKLDYYQQTCAPNCI